jgi:hypothetical protein
VLGRGAYRLQSAKQAKDAFRGCAGPYEGFVVCAAIGSHRVQEIRHQMLVWLCKANEKDTEERRFKDLVKKHSEFLGFPSPKRRTSPILKRRRRKQKKAKMETNQRWRKADRGLEEDEKKKKLEELKTECVLLSKHVIEALGDTVRARRARQEFRLAPEWRTRRAC